MIQLIVADSTVHVALQRASASWPWYVIRAAGFTAAGLLFLLMLSGIGQVTGLTYRFLAPIKAWALHKALAIALCVAVVIHGGLLLIDNYIRFSVPDILVPFVSHYNNKSQLLGLPFSDLAIGFGILAAYGIAVIVLSSLSWIDTKKGAWKNLHYLSYGVVVLVFLHALYAGTDLRYGAFRAIWMLVGFIVLLGIISRLARRGSMAHTKSESS
jgi:DMSO/TMAO reductase YedYZ heme-binding membrane subunit